jgi:hypothetical protein
LLFFPAFLQAKIWTVDNRYGNAAAFPNIQDANNAASGGDTLYVAGSYYGYGDATIDRQLVIIGPGYFLDQNYINFQNQDAAHIGNMYLAADGVVIQGLEADWIYVRASNLVIKRNVIGGSIRFESGSRFNINIIQNYIGGWVSIGGNCCSWTGSNIIVSGNYIGGYFEENNNNGVPQSSEGISVSNNVFARSCTINNELVFNNIFLTTDADGLNLAGSNVQNNICTGTQLPVGFGNQLNVDMNTVFISGSSAKKVMAKTKQSSVAENVKKKPNDTYTTDGQWMLKAGSPAVKAGLNGADIGMYGGSYAYVLSGLPPVPVIYQLEVSPSGNNASGVSVQAKIRTTN